MPSDGELPDCIEFIKSKCNPIWPSMGKLEFKDISDKKQMVVVHKSVLEILDKNEFFDLRFIEDAILNSPLSSWCVFLKTNKGTGRHYLFAKESTMAIISSVEVKDWYIHVLPYVGE